LLAQKGVIALDDDIRKYVPEIPRLNWLTEMEQHTEKS